MANFTEIRIHAGLSDEEACIDVETGKKVFVTPAVAERWNEAAMYLMECNRD